eukprot:TRINITY_DN912_c0_g1_i16.p2 TRINITY_DN912_c0_g1~~TRINITY_DN912_c0_g1_i16.p2  ORF type:complete len:107 (+),score=22.59 TRINITY_DN912_c0_g1_i16:209-529(+)
MEMEEPGGKMPSSRAERMTGYGVDTTEMVFADDVLDDGSSLEVAVMETESGIRLARTQEWERFLLMWEGDHHREAVQLLARETAMNPRRSKGLRWTRSRRQSGSSS